jgi:hypothetical protein
MLPVEQRIFLNFPHEAETRVLHPATITEAGERSYTAQLDEPDLPFVAGQDVFVYFDSRRRFLKQAARIDVVMQTAPKIVVGFRTIGEPMPAESRERYRVFTAVSDLTVGFGAEKGCRLLDVSSVGLAVEATQRYQVGDVVTVTLSFEGRQYDGQGRIQSIRELSPNRYRYGVHSIKDRTAGGNLLKGQQIVSAALERQQLRRLARSG